MGCVLAFSDQNFPIQERKPFIMNVTDYLQEFASAFGYSSLEAAKASLSPQALQDMLAEFYQSNNGNDGTLLWTEVLAAL